MTTIANQNKSIGWKQGFVRSLAAVCWLSLAAQLGIFFSKNAMNFHGAATAVITFFRLFTILTNLFLALVVTAHARNAPREGFFNRPSTATAVLTYIIILMLVYNLLLRGLWHFGGFESIIDLLLHDLIPIAYFIFWLFIIPKGTLRWSYALPWLLYPVGYAIYNGFLSALTGGNPYPFLSATAIGFPTVLRNILLLSFVFFVTGALFIAFDRAIGRRGLSHSSPR